MRAAAVSAAETPPKRPVLRGQDALATRGRDARATSSPGCQPSPQPPHRAVRPWPLRTYRDGAYTRPAGVAGRTSPGPSAAEGGCDGRRVPLGGRTVLQRSRRPRRVLHARPVRLRGDGAELRDCPGGRRVHRRHVGLHGRAGAQRRAGRRRPPQPQPRPPARPLCGPEPLPRTARPDPRRRPPGPARAARRDDGEDGRGRRRSSTGSAAAGPGRAGSSVPPPGRSIASSASSRTRRSRGTRATSASSAARPSTSCWRCRSGTGSSAAWSVGSASARSR